MPLGSCSPQRKPPHVPLKGKKPLSGRGKRAPASSPAAPSPAGASLAPAAPHPCSDRKDQKALGGCYGNSFKLDQYLARGAVRVTDVGAGGCDSRSGAGPPHRHPQPRAVPPHRGRAAAAPQLAGTAHGAAAAGAHLAPTSASPREDEGRRRAWGGSHKCHQENLFSASPSAAKARGAEPGCRQAHGGLRAPRRGSTAVSPRPVTGSRASSSPLGATRHLPR